jgi:hypothetical protein
MAGYRVMHATTKQLPPSDRWWTKGVPLINYFIESLGIPNTIKVNLREQWDTQSLPDCIGDFLGEALEKKIEALEGNVSELTPLEDECLHELLNVWRQENAAGLHQDIIHYFDEEASTIIQVFISDDKNSPYFEFILSQAIEKILDHPEEILEGEAQNELREIFNHMGKEILECKARNEIDKNIFSILQDNAWHNLIGPFDRETLTEKHGKKIVTWLNENDIPAILNAIVGLNELVFPKLRSVVQDALAANNKNEEFLEALIASLKNPSLDPISLCDTPGLDVLPDRFQSAHEERVNILQEKIHVVKGLPLSFKIANLKAFSDLYTDIHRLQEELFPNYPRSQMNPQKFPQSKEEYAGLVESRTYVQPLLKAGSLSEVQEIFAKWRGNQLTQENKDLALVLDAHFKENILLNWLVLPKELQNWLEEQMKSEGSASEANFSYWIDGSGPSLSGNSCSEGTLNIVDHQETTTRLFAPVLADHFIVGNGDLTLQSALEAFSAHYFLQARSEHPAFQAALFESLKKTWDQKAFHPESLMSKKLGDRFTTLFKLHSKHGKLQQGFTIPQLREQALHDLLIMQLPKQEENAALYGQFDAFAEPIILAYWKQTEHQEEWRNFLIPTIEKQLVRYVKEHENFPREALSVIFREHFSSLNNRPAILQHFAIAELQVAYQNREAPAQKWLYVNDLPFMHELTMFLLTLEGDYFAPLDALPLRRLRADFPEFTDAEGIRRGLKTLHDTPADEIRRLNMWIFKDLPFERVKEYVARFTSLALLDLSLTNYSFEEMRILYEAAGRPQSLMIQKAAHLSRFDIGAFKGLVSLDLSESGVQEIVGTSDTLKKLTLDSCLSLSYAEIAKMASQVPALKAHGMPHINGDLLCAAYPLLEPYRESLENIEQPIFETLFAHLELPLNRFEKIKLFSNEAQIAALNDYVVNHMQSFPDLFAHFIPALEKGEFKALELFLSMPLLRPEIESLVLNHALISAEGASTERSFVARKLLSWLHDEFSFDTERAKRIYPVALRSIIYCAGIDNNLLEASQLFCRLGPIAERTTALLTRQEIFEEKHPNSLLVPTDGIIRLFGSADYSRKEIKDLLKAYFEAGILRAETSRLMILAATDYQEVEALCTNIFEEDLYASCRKSLEIAVEKFSEIKAKLINELKNPSSKIRKRAIDSLIQADREDKVLLQAFIEHEPTENDPESRVSILQRFSYEKNVEVKFQEQFLRVATSQTSTLAELEVVLPHLPSSDLNDAGCQAVVALLNSADLTIRHLALGVLCNAKLIDVSILEIIARQSWDGLKLRDYLNKTVPLEPSILMFLFENLTNMCPNRKEFFRISIRRFFNLAPLFVRDVNPSLEATIPYENKNLLPWGHKINTVILHSITHNQNMVEIILEELPENCARYQYALERLRYGSPKLDDKLLLLVVSCMSPKFQSENRSISQSTSSLNITPPDFELETCMKFLSSDAQSCFAALSQIKDEISKSSGKWYVESLFRELDRIFCVGDEEHKRHVLNALTRLSSESLEPHLTELSPEFCLAIISYNYADFGRKTALRFLLKINMSQEDLERALIDFYLFDSFESHHKHGIPVLLGGMPQFKGVGLRAREALSQTDLVRVVCSYVENKKEII